MQQHNMINVPVRDLTLESAKWVYFEIIGRSNPHVSSRYIEDEKGFIVGTESYVTYGTDLHNEVMEVLKENKMRITPLDECWKAEVHIERDIFGEEVFANSLMHVILLAYIKQYFDRSTVPQVLQDNKND